MRLALFAAHRLAGILLVLLMVALVTFTVFYLLPTNPAVMSCGRPCTPENLARAEAFLGMDHPWYVQFWSFFSGIFVGRSFGTEGFAITCAAPCFGYSFQQNASVTELILARFPVTLSIAIGAAILWLIIGVGAGVLAALRHGTAVDRGVMLFAITGVSAPSYLVGLLAILLFSFALGVFPSGGYVPFDEDPTGWAWHLVLPWVTLALINAAIYARITRGQMLEVMSEDYIRTARAKGMSETRVVARHGVRNAILPIITIFGLDLGALLGGAVIAEKVFSMPGLGALLLDAVHTLDLQLVVGFTMFAAFIIVVANFAVDLLYSAVDPRVSVGG